MNVSNDVLIECMLGTTVRQLRQSCGELFHTMISFGLLYNQTTDIISSEIMRKMRENEQCLSCTASLNISLGTLCGSEHCFYVVPSDNVPGVADIRWDNVLSWTCKRKKNPTM